MAVAQQIGDYIDNRKVTQWRPLEMPRRVRRAALHALDEAGPPANGPPTIADRHLDRSMHELLVEGGPLTGSLLGAARTPSVTPPRA